jgi:glycosyltransferase involved in cell wall biosynthesis
MASGLPVVSTAVGGIPAVVVENVTGALVPPCDPDTLSARLGQLAASPTLGLKWGTEGRRRALSRYSADRMVDDYFAVYERIQGS